MFKKFNKNEKILLFLFVLIILIIRNRNIFQLQGVQILDDEIGYWSHAANMNGYSWIYMTKAWYSYGYSLILFPLFWITSNMTILYKIAIELNAIMGVITFFIGFSIFDKLEPKLNKSIKIILSFVATCYSSYIFQTNIAWSETFLYMWFLFVLCLSLKFFENPTMKNNIFLCLSTFFLYIIHNRCIAIVIAYLIIIILMWLKKRLNTKQLLVSFIILIFGYWIDFTIKNALENIMWGGTSTKFTSNAMSSEFQKLKLFTSLDGWIILIKSFLGKLWYLLTSTLMIAYFGIVNIIKNLILIIREKKEKIYQDKYFLFYSFLILCICGVLGISSIAMNKSFDNRIDIFIYGRYSDMIVWILIVLGLKEILNDSKKQKKSYVPIIILGIIIYCICSIIAYIDISSVKSPILNSSCVPGLFMLPWKKFDIFKCVLIVLAVCFLLLIISFYENKKIRKKILCKKSLLISIILTIFFVIVSQNCYKVGLYPLIDKYYERSSENVLKFINENLDFKIYLNIDDYFLKQTIRSRFVKTKVKYGLPKKDEENYILIVDTKKFKKIDIESYDLYHIVNSDEIFVLVDGDKIIKHLKNKGYEFKKIESTKIEKVSEENINLELFSKDKVKIKKGESIKVGLKIIKNTESILNFENKKISYHIYNKNKEKIVWDGSRYLIDTVMFKDIKMNINIEDKIFEKSGKYLIEIDIVEEGVSWFSDKVKKLPIIEVIVK